MNPKQRHRGLMAAIGRGWLRQGQRQVAQCIAYREDGKICGEVATVLDAQRGGMVCEKHRLDVPPSATEMSLPGV